MVAGKPCRFESRLEGCRFGASCNFSHLGVRISAVSKGTGRPTVDENRSVSTTKAEFRNWRFMIPKDGHSPDSPDTLNPRLSQLFLKGAELVDLDPGIRQDVVMYMASTGGLSRVKELIEQGTGSLEASIYITDARAICAAHPGSTAGLLDEVDAVERMLRAETFFSTVTSEERRAVLAAMATEFRGTGHWYYCQNRHPFTVGECGMDGADGLSAVRRAGRWQGSCARGGGEEGGRLGGGAGDVASVDLCGIC